MASKILSRFEAFVADKNTRAQVNYTQSKQSQIPDTNIICLCTSHTETMEQSKIWCLCQNLKSPEVLMNQSSWESKLKHVSTSALHRNSQTILATQ